MKKDEIYEKIDELEKKRMAYLKVKEMLEEV